LRNASRRHGGPKKTASNWFLEGKGKVKKKVLMVGFIPGMEKKKARRRTARRGTQGWKHWGKSWRKRQAYVQDKKVEK